MIGKSTIGLALNILAFNNKYDTAVGLDYSNTHFYLRNCWRLYAKTCFTIIYLFIYYIGI